MQICPGCGEENPDRFLLCGFCGTPLQAAPAAQDVRRTVSVVFCDLKGSTSLGESIDTETLREVLNHYFREMQAILERHGGTVEKFIGDAIMAVFGLPILHEDDALRAVRAAWDMKQELERINDDLELRWGVRLENRTGVNTGEVVAGDATARQRLVTGDTVNVAARLEQAAPPMEILIGEPTYRLVRDAVVVEAVAPLPLKGKAEPVPAYRMLGVTRSEGIARRLDVPMVGRHEELGVLLDALDRATAERTPQLAVVLGPAGVGKSRLLAEFLVSVADHTTVLRGRCLPYGEGITFWPLAEVVRDAARIVDEDDPQAAIAKLRALLVDGEPGVVERIASAIGLSEDVFAIEETFWAARSLLQILARPRPLIVLIDDLHWAERTFLDLLAHVLDAADDAPLVITASARIELFEDHPNWVDEGPSARRIELGPLSESHSALVIDHLLGDAQMDPDVRGRIIAAAEGNPLYVEQMLSMLVDDGTLELEDGRWVSRSPIASIAVPPTIAALLSSRLGRLAPGERAVIERASVVGQVFYPSAVLALAEHGPASIDVELTSLTRRQLIRPAESTFAAESAYRFAHLLVRDAAYGGLLKRTRAHLHERFAGWLEDEARIRVGEQEEIVGYHYEQAFLYRSELAPLEEGLRELGRRGAGHLAYAGRRAYTRGDMPAAANLLERAARILPADDPERMQLMLELGETLVELGEFGRADEVLEEVAERSARSGDRGAETTARTMQLHMHYITGVAQDTAAVVERAHAAIATLEGLGHHRGLALAWRVIMTVHGTACRYGEAEAAGLQVIEHARLAADQLLEVRARAPLALCAVYGPTPSREAAMRCEQLLAEAGGDRRAESLLMCALAHLYAMQLDFEHARDLYQHSRTTLGEMGFKLLSALTSLDSGAVEMLARDPAAAERELRRDHDALEAMGEKNYISTVAALLAEAVYRQGRYDEADELASSSEAIAAPDDVESQALWRCVRGKVLARRGATESAEALLREAVALIDTTDGLDARGNVRMDLAEVLRLAGRRDEAAVAATEAADLFTRKGNEASARAAAELLAELQTPSAAAP